MSGSPPPNLGGSMLYSLQFCTAWLKLERGWCTADPSVQGMFEEVWGRCPCCESPPLFSRVSAARAQPVPLLGSFLSQMWDLALVFVALHAVLVGSICWGLSLRWLLLLAYLPLLPVWLHLQICNAADFKCNELVSDPVSTPGKLCL